MLENKFYTIISQDDSRFVIELKPDCDVYRGHFPGEPVSPGVCSIQMVKELMEKLTHHSLLLNDLKQVRFTTLITPKDYSRLNVNILVETTHASSLQSDNSYSFHATVGENDNVFVELKGTATIVK